jgi:hypothetical protein
MTFFEYVCSCCQERPATVYVYEKGWRTTFCDKCYELKKEVKK